MTKSPLPEKGDLLVGIPCIVAAVVMLTLSAYHCGRKEGMSELREKARSEITACITADTCYAHSLNLIITPMKRTTDIMKREVETIKVSKKGGNK